MKAGDLIKQAVAAVLAQVGIIWLTTWVLKLGLHAPAGVTIAACVLVAMALSRWQGWEPWGKKAHRR